MKNGMTNSELYYYRQWRSAGMAIALGLIVEIAVAAFFILACMSNRPGYAIALGCLLFFVMFVIRIKCTDATRYYKRAFPRGDTDGLKL